MKISCSENLGPSQTFLGMYVYDLLVSLEYAGLFQALIPQALFSFPSLSFQAFQFLCYLPQLLSFA